MWPSLPETLRPRFPLQADFRPEFPILEKVGYEKALRGDSLALESGPWQCAVAEYQWPSPGRHQRSGCFGINTMRLICTFGPEVVSAASSILPSWVSRFETGRANQVPLPSYSLSVPSQRLSQ